MRVTLGALVAAGLLAIGAPFASAHSGAHPKPGDGDNGTVKVHRCTTSDHDMRNEPKVCKFYLVGFHFDAAQAVSWKIESWPPTGDRSVVKTGTLVLDENGWGRTENMTLANGHYKLFWNFVGENGRAKHKVFWVNCPSASESPTPTPSKSTPSTPSTPPSGKPSPSPTHTAPAGAPTPVRTNLPVTG
jgi:hypothetical protein